MLYTRVRYSYAVDPPPRRMKLQLLLWVCLLLAVAPTRQEGEEKTGSGPKKPVFREPSYPSGDVHFVETFTDTEKVWKRS